MVIYLHIQNLFADNDAHLAIMAIVRQIRVSVHY